MTGAGGRHTPFSLEMTRDQEGQTPGRFPGPRPLPGPGVHPGRTGEPTTESRPGGSRTPGHPWCPLESVASCLLPVLTPSQAFTICWMLLSLMKTGFGNLACPGERRHWDASRWAYLLTNLRVSSFTFGLNRLVLAAYHGPCSRVKAAARRRSQSDQQGGRGGRPLGALCWLWAPCGGRWGPRTGPEGRGDGGGRWGARAAPEAGRWQSSLVRRARFLASELSRHPVTVLGTERLDTASGGLRLNFRESLRWPGRRVPE